MATLCPKKNPTVLQPWHPHGSAALYNLESTTSYTLHRRIRRPFWALEKVQGLATFWVWMNEFFGATRLARRLWDEAA